jgi:ATP-binding cassette subfamily F protein uup
VSSARSGASKVPATSGGAAPASSIRKLSYKDQRELAALPADIDKLEAEQRLLGERMSAADYHRVAPAQMQTDSLRASELEILLAQKIARWDQLQTLADSIRARKA